MPLRLPSLNFAIKCEENELRTYEVKKDGPGSITAFVASEAGKQFRIKCKNNLLDFSLSNHLYIDGKRVGKLHLSAGEIGRMKGIYNSPTSILPFKFQEVTVVDPDLENAPVIPEMGTIELRAFRCRGMRRTRHQLGAKDFDGLHQGCVSERSKKAGWHHVSTADEVPIRARNAINSDYVDPLDAPCAVFKVFYRPRELLMAQGVITGPDIGAGPSGISELNNRKRTREGGSPGPSKRRSIKKEGRPVTERAQRIQTLQAELDSLIAEQSRSSVKRELRSPSPIVVGQAAGEVIDLTLEG